MIYKKHIIGSFLLFSVFVSFISCDKNLDINPTSELESVYFENERIQRGVGAAYAGLANIYGPQYSGPGPLHPFWLLPGDDMTPDGSGNTFDTFSGLTGSDGRVDGIWD
jgi:hypothetical protein